MRYTTLIRLIISTASLTSTAFAIEAANNSAIDAFLPEEVYPELQAIINSAEINAPSLQTHRNYNDEASERYEQAKARRYLNAKLYANIGPRNEYYQSGNSEDTSTFAMNTGINLYRPIYHWGAIEAGIKQAQLGSQSANLELEQKRSDLIRNLRADFLQLHLAEQAYNNELKKQKITDETIKRAELEHKSGKISKVKLRSILLEKEQSELSLERISARKQQITERFATTYGWKNPLKITATIPALDLEQALHWHKTAKQSLSKSAVYQLYPIQQQLNSLEHHKEQQVIIAANTRPLFNLFLSGVQGQRNTATDNDVSSFAVTAGINVSWNIFDGFRTRHQKMEAKIKQRRLEAQLEISASDLLLEQQRILNSLGLRLRELNILEQRYSIQSDEYLEAKQDLEAGRITEPQLQASELALETMQYKLYEARANTLMGISDYREFTRMTTTEN